MSCSLIHNSSDSHSGLGYHIWDVTYEMAVDVGLYSMSLPSARPPNIQPYTQLPTIIPPLSFSAAHSSYHYHPIHHKANPTHSLHRHPPLGLQPPPPQILHPNPLPPHLPQPMAPPLHRRFLHLLHPLHLPPHLPHRLPMHAHLRLLGPRSAENRQMHKLDCRPPRNRHLRGHR